MRTDSGMVDEAHIGKCSWTAYEDETRRWNVNRVRRRIARHDDDRLHNGIANERDEPHAAVCRKVYRHALHAGEKDEKRKFCNGFDW